MDYAIGLARSEGELLYEEMHELFSLSDEIEALQSLGLETARSRANDLADALRFRFALEKNKAHLVAEDRFDESKTGWWYTENL